jgi:hypothetical protein
MLIPFGILSAAGAGEEVAGAYELIESHILGSTTAEITFSSLDTYASTYKHLQIRMVSKLTTTSTATDLLMRFNGVTTSSYAGHRLLGNGSSVLSDSRASSSSAFIGLVDGDQFTPAVIDVLDVYATKNKTVRTLVGVRGFASEVMLTSGLFNSTAAITSMTLLLPATRFFAAGSRFSLYGIKG